MVIAFSSWVFCKHCQQDGGRRGDIDSKVVYCCPGFPGGCQIESRGRHMWTDKPIALSACAFFLGAASSGIALVHIRHVSPAVNIPTVTPFTSQTTKNYYNSEGKLGRSETILYLRFRNRRTAYEVTQTYPTVYTEIVDIVDIPAGQRIYLEPLSKSKHTLRYTPQELAQSFLDLPSESCPSDLEWLDRNGVFFGYHTRHSVEQVTPTWREETWMIPELQCYPVKQLDYLLKANLVEAHNEAVVTSLTVGEPTAAAIPDPSGYVERSPKEVEKEVERLSPGRKFWGATVVDQMERQYQRHH